MKYHSNTNWKGVLGAGAAALVIFGCGAGIGAVMKDASDNSTTANASKNVFSTQTTPKAESGLDLKGLFDSFSQTGNLSAQDIANIYDSLDSTIQKQICTILDMSEQQIKACDLAALKEKAESLSEGQKKQLANLLQDAISNYMNNPQAFEKAPQNNQPALPGQSESGGKEVQNGNEGNENGNDQADGLDDPSQNEGRKPFGNRPSAGNPFEGFERDEDAYGYFDEGDWDDFFADDESSDDWDLDDFFSRFFGSGSDWRIEGEDEFEDDYGFNEQNRQKKGRRSNQNGQPYTENQQRAGTENQQGNSPFGSGRRNDSGMQEDSRSSATTKDLSGRTGIRSSDTTDL